MFLFHKIPSGVGQGRHAQLKESDYQKLCTIVSRWSIEQGFGESIDLEHTESYGCIPGARFDTVSQRAKERGKDQLGTVGSGNHFVEMGEIGEFYDDKTAGLWGLQKGEVYILIHSGSRGFGHQVCQDTLDLYMKEGLAHGLPDKQLVAAPIKSQLGSALSFCSSCHGAGRAKSRFQALREGKGTDPVEQMRSQGVLVMARSDKTILEEMPSCYKDVDSVVEATEKAGFAKKVARLLPKIVLKG